MDDRQGRLSDLILDTAERLRRHQARIAADALRQALATGWKTAGEPSTAHLLMARPRRSVWHTTWRDLPGLAMDNDQFSHELLPGWSYTAEELAAEMLPDLEKFAATGEQPKEATR
jgi:hypothetical protein